MSAGSSLPPSFQFGQCQLSLHRRELRRAGRAVGLGGRAYDILLVLIERRGKVVGKHELIELVWPGRIIEENTLEAQMAALRRALGDDRSLIRTISGRGYQFAGDLLTLDQVKAGQRLPVSHLPEGLTSLVGRDADIRRIVVLARTRRLITLAGSGGVGKTRLAVEIARILAREMPGGAALVELGLLSSGEFVGQAVAGALGFPLGAGTPSLDRIASAISTRETLVVLDNCEHVVEAAAHMAEALLQAGPGLKVIATSREPLRAAGEYVYRVPTLEVPSEEIEDVDSILRHSAVQLFRARAGSLASQMPADQGISLSARICRCLDGIPLAIELAASRVQTLGLEAVASRLHDRFDLLTNGVRTALPRQQTLRATLDWSFELLSGAEQTVLARLSVFTGPFLLDGAVYVATGEGFAQPEVVECLAGLVAKSLVSADRAATPRYRLLETTRMYAMEKLARTREVGDFSARHARYHLDLAQRGEADWEIMPTASWIAIYGRNLEGIRAAIEWSFSPEGDPAVGAAVTTSSIPIWTQMGLLEELLGRVETALSHLDRSAIPAPTARMKLLAALGAARLYQGVGRETDSAFRLALAEAECLGNEEYQLRGIWGRWSVAYICGRYTESLTFARRFEDVAAARDFKADRLVGERMTGMSLFCLGQLKESAPYLERVVVRYAAPASRSHLIRFIYEQRIIAMNSLAHVRWHQGFADKAAQAAAESIEEARAIDHAPSICNALTEGVCAIAVLRDGVGALEGPTELAVQATRRHGISTWKARGQMWHGLHVLALGDAGAYKRIIVPALNEIGEAIFVAHCTGFVSATCEQLGANGLVEDGLELVERAIARARLVGDGCSLAELLRVRGELWSRSAESALWAEPALEEAMSTAREQESLGWRLRCATSLARAKQRRGAFLEARDLLSPLYDEFTEGFISADLRLAREVLNVTPA